MSATETQCPRASCCVRWEQSSMGSSSSSSKMFATGSVRAVGCRETRTCRSAVLSMIDSRDDAAQRYCSLLYLFVFRLRLRTDPTMNLPVMLATPLPFAARLCFGFSLPDQAWRTRCFHKARCEALSPMTMVEKALDSRSLPSTAMLRRDLLCSQTMSNCCLLATGKSRPKAPIPQRTLFSHHCPAPAPGIEHGEAWVDRYKLGSL